MRTLFFILALVGMLSAPATVWAQASLRIGVVDIQRALNETEDGRKAKQRLKNIFQKRQQSLDSRQNELKRMKEDIERQQRSGGISEKVLRSRLQTYQKGFVELQTIYVEYQRELAKKEAELTKGILARMQDILKRIGQAEGYEMIVERNEGGVTWARSDLDVTDRLIQTYNSGAGKKKKPRKKK